MPDLGLIKIKFPSLSGIVANLILLAFLLAGLFFVFQVVLGGISWINSGGDPKALDSARSRITNALIGLVIIAAALAISKIVTNALGINIFRLEGVPIVPVTTQ